MILAAGLTPAWQQILLFDTLNWGEVNRASQAQWCASGKVLNVGLALGHLAAQARTLAPLGGPGGKAIREEFETLGLSAHWIDTASPTRVCTTLLERETQRTTELVENARPLAKGELTAFLQAYVEESSGAEVVVLTGSLGLGVPAEFYRALIAQTKARVVLDARGQELLHALEARPFLVKPNRQELAQTLGRTLDTEDALMGGMRELLDRGATWVVVSDGKEALWAFSAEGIMKVIPPKVEVVNPIGSGDCLAAGLAFGLQQGLGMEDTVCLGMAAAVENVRFLLPGRVDPYRVRLRAQELKEDGEIR